MSKQVQSRRLTVPEITQRKGGEKLVCLTAYTAPMAALLDEHVDLLLVGDSVGMVLHGLPTTLGVTLEMMILHAQAVMRGSRQAMVVVDMPFGSYEQSPAHAYASAARLMAETGCAGVKLEGGQAMAETIAFLTQRGIPVMAHVGLTPQSVNALGGYAARGRNQQEHEKIIADGQAVARAGAFAVVIEGVVEPIAVALTQSVEIPTIGIGASAQCDGQVLVTEDMLGMFERVPRFVKRYGAMAEEITAAAELYAREVRERSFPGADQVYSLD
jgi:3-methyl-2-oxobutanoate hydroxymethyltransferase